MRRGVAPVGVAAAEAMNLAVRVPKVAAAVLLASPGGAAGLPADGEQLKLVLSSWQPSGNV